MQRKSYIQQHPHQEISRGRAPYASSTGMKPSTNESMDFQLLANRLRHKSIIDHSYLEDEDSDERTIYFAKNNNTSKKK